mgnify:CR=1 FL=1
MQNEQTLILVKPDGVARGLTGEILRRVEAKGYRLADIKLVNAERALLEAHYEEHRGKPFFEPLIEFMSSGPIVAVRAEGQRVIEGFRSLAGATDPTTAAPGTIRGDYAQRVDRNIVHGSDSPENGEREVGIFFTDAEIMDYDPAFTHWL